MALTSAFSGSATVYAAGNGNISTGTTAFRRLRWIN